MLKIEEGMYVKTKKGIGKVVEHKKHESWGYLVKIIGQYSCYTHTSNGKLTDVIKASHNIIDLIEAGDYVNGNKVIRIETSSYPEDKNVKIIVCCGDDDYYVYYNEDIKTILIKEQYENNCYRIDE